MDNDAKERGTYLPLNLPPRGLSRQQAAEYIGISATKFDQLVTDGRMPHAVQIDGRKVWDRHALDRAFDALAGYPGDVNEWDTVL